ncbi:MAG: hypothetical protein OXE05_13340 [Chloroflexi bacterium]|nr:hypothetical protein [Chloroflexota bacterium]
MVGRIVTGIVVILAAIALVACDTASTATQPAASQSPLASLPSLDEISREAEPGLYTQAFVAEAIRRYDADGREATLAHFNNPESVDGEWYMFIIGEDGEVLAHSAIPDNVGLFVKKPLGVDANGYDFGTDMLAATEQGSWVSYVYENPARDNLLETKHAWVVKHDGLIFASGWYQVDRYDAPPQQRPPTDPNKVIAQLAH